MTGGDTWLGHAREVLLISGRRAGAGREQVMRELADHGCLLGAQEITDRLRARGRPVSQPTVYRTLDTLHELDLVTRIDAGEGIARYEPAGAGVGHHHSVCDRCGKVLAFSDDALDDALERVSRRLPFRVQRRELVLHGACTDCTAEAPP